jgi:hypothetical protein
MEARYGIAERVWVMDRGMTSAENVEWLQETGHRYLLGTAKSELKRWSRELAEEREWQQVREGVEVKLCPGPQGTETFLQQPAHDPSRRSAASRAPTSCSRWPTSPIANSASAASSAPTRPRRCCSIGSGCGCPNAFGSRHPCARCSADSRS